MLLYIGSLFKNMNLKYILVLIFTVTAILCDEKSFKINTKYLGEKFPVKYLVPDDTIPTVSDLNYYIGSLKRTVGYFFKYPNETHTNTAIALFYMKSILKKTFQDSKRNLSKYQLMAVSDMINDAEYVISHYVYDKAPYGWSDLEYRVTRLLTDDKPQVYSISAFNRNRLKGWISTKEKMNDFIEQLDDTTLPKEKYVELLESMNDYFPISNSDECISRLSFNPEPINVMDVRQCRPDPMCAEGVLARPSVAYALSHRLLIIMGLRQIRRCYLHSVEFHDLLMDELCANMYREAVYIARRGYFARDIFLEHVAFCSMLGYEEFHRRNWYYKAISWMDQNGCMKENFNLQVNSTKFNLVRYRNNPEELKKIRMVHDLNLSEECHRHPMALLLIFLPSAIRHAAHFLTKTVMQS